GRAMFRPTHFRRTVVFAVSTIISLMVVGRGDAQSGYNGSMDSGNHGHHSGHSFAVPFAYGGYGDYHASTAAEGFLRGKAAVIDAIGSFEVNDAQAAILREHARALDRDNDLKQTEALHLQKKMWNDARIEARKQRQIRAAEGQQILAQRRATVYRD